METTVYSPRLEKFRHRRIETITRNVPRQTFVQRNGVSRANATASQAARLARFVKIYRAICNLTPIARGERRSRRNVRSISNRHLGKFVLLRVESLAGNRRCVLDREKVRDREREIRSIMRIVEIEFLEGD